MYIQLVSNPYFIDSPNLQLFNRDDYKVMYLCQRYISFLTAHQEDCLSEAIIFDKPYQLLRENYSDDELRLHGVFFSGREVAKQLLSCIQKYDYQHQVMDPCCGAGDLLLAYAVKLPPLADPKTTILEWAKILHGNDSNADFVNITKLRLVLLANYILIPSITIQEVISTWEQYTFPFLTVGNALDINTPDIDIVLLNPPYQQIVVNKIYSWGKGKISMAAVFIYEFYYKYPKAIIAAILPDVIRSGSRYIKLRQDLSMFPWKCAQIYGRFDKRTDVDVFTISNNSKISSQNNKDIKKNTETIASYFSVHVGSVVPHRDPIKGPSHFFLTAKNLPSKGEVTSFTETRESLRTFHKGPFLVMRRTSSPTDKVRCATTIINSSEDFFIENHLIVLIPKNGKLETCRAAYNFLVSQQCNVIVNKMIRCRHLTTSAISNLPYIEEKE